MRLFDAGELRRTGARSDRQEHHEPDQPRLRRRTVADLHSDAARLVSAISQLQDVRDAARTVTLGQRNYPPLPLLLTLTPSIHTNTRPGRCREIPEVLKVVLKYP